MKRITRDSITRMSVVLVLLTLTSLPVGIGCSDDGSPTNPDDGGNGGDNDTGMVVDTVISFAQDVFPVLSSNCTPCHIPQTRISLSLNGYDALMRGSNQGNVVIPGDAENSEIIKRLEDRSQRGTKASMPLGRGLLPTATVKIIRDWIDQGAVNN